MHDSSFLLIIYNVTQVPHMAACIDSRPKPEILSVKKEGKHHSMGTYSDTVL